MAWILAAIAGIPVLLVTAWGLAGSYSFRYLPSLLVAPAIPFVVAPLVAAFLTWGWPGRVSQVVALGIVICCAGASGLAVLAIGFTIPFALLDDSGHATDNFGSLVAAGLLVLVYLAVAIVTAITLGGAAIGRSPMGRPARRSILWKSGSVAGTCALLLLLSGVAGSANASRLDGSGIPIEPGAAWMASRPESSLVYPGAAGTSTGASGADKQLSHSGDAKGGVTFYTSDPPAAVATFYAERLGVAGWKPVGIGRAGEDQVFAFKRGDRELFVIRYYKPRGRFPDQAQHPGQGVFVTTYSVFEIGAPHI